MTCDRREDASCHESLLTSASFALGPTLDARLLCERPANDFPWRSDHFLRHRAFRKAKVSSGQSPKLCKFAVRTNKASLLASASRVMRHLLLHCVMDYYSGYVPFPTEVSLVPLDLTRQPNLPVTILTLFQGKILCIKLG